MIPLVGGLIFAVVVLAAVVFRLEKRVHRLSRKLRHFQVRFQILEKAAGLEQTKTDAGKRVEPS